MLSLASLVLASVGGAPAARAEVRVGLRLLPTYFHGDFGSGIETDLYDLPIIVTVASDRQQFRLTVPYLSITTAEPVTFTGGEIIRRGGGAQGSATNSGIGDVVVQEEYDFVQGGAKRPWISGIARLKLPTADETKGLGTGEADYGPGLAIVQPAGSRASLLFEAQYVVRGDPPSVNFRNTWWLSAGAQWRRGSANSFSLFLDDRQSVLAGREALRDLSLGFDRRLSGSVTFRSAAYAGLSSTAEDFGLMAGFSFQKARP